VQLVEQGRQLAMMQLPDTPRLNPAALATARELEAPGAEASPRAVFMKAMATEERPASAQQQAAMPAMPAGMGRAARARGGGGGGGGGGTAREPVRPRHGRARPPPLRIPSRNVPVRRMLGSRLGSPSFEGALVNLSHVYEETEPDTFFQRRSGGGGGGGGSGSLSAEGTAGSGGGGVAGSGCAEGGVPSADRRAGRRASAEVLQALRTDLERMQEQIDTIASIALARADDRRQQQRRAKSEEAATAVRAAAGRAP
jgi:hypothetical protein